ncbi:hypothetical protein IPZ70_20860 [Streptomyces polychromogenes]|nr:hypothetical protein [Streptomyces polychromogenes]
MTDERDWSRFISARERLEVDRADTLARIAALGRDFAAPIRVPSTFTRVAPQGSSATITRPPASSRAAAGVAW